jgi:hypothetical protein
MAADRTVIDPWLTELAGDTDTSRATVWQGMDPFPQALLLKTVPEAGACRTTTAAGADCFLLTTIGGAGR